MKKPTYCKGCDYYHNAGHKTGSSLHNIASTIIGAVIIQSAQQKLNQSANFKTEKKYQKNIDIVSIFYKLNTNYKNKVK